MNSLRRGMHGLEMIMINNKNTCMPDVCDELYIVQKLKYGELMDLLQ